MTTRCRLLLCALLTGSAAFAQEPKPAALPTPPPPVPAPAVPEKPEAKPEPPPSTAVEKGLTDPKEILIKANDATDAVKSVRYKVEIRRLDTPPYQTNEVKGSVLMTGWDGEKPEKFRFEIETRPAGMSEVGEVVLGSDGKQFYAINKKAKTAYVGTDISALGTYVLSLRYFPMYEFVIPNPFGDEINAAKLQFLGTEKINDEECAEVHVKYVSQNQESVWCFSKRDWLPRRVKRLFIDPEGSPMHRQTIVSDIVVDPKLDEDAFAFKLPEGYKQVEGGGP